MSTVLAEIERLVRVSVKVDIAAFIAAYPDERKQFEGTDEEYVRHFLDQEAYGLIRDGCVDEGDGVSVEEEWDETDTTILGVA